MVRTTTSRREKREVDYRSEVARKFIHLSSLLIPLIYCQISRDLALTILAPVTAGFLFVDILKNFVPTVSHWYHDTFDTMLRSHELRRDHVHLNGATWITLSALILIFAFPKMIAISAFAMVSISDTMAALVGRKFGKHRFGDKSVEGSAAFLVSALLIAVFLPGFRLIPGIAMAVAATLTEAIDLRAGHFRIDDNITIPIVTALVGMGVYLLFYPSDMPELGSCP